MLVFGHDANRISEKISLIEIAVICRFCNLKLINITTQTKDIEKREINVL